MGNLESKVEVITEENIATCRVWGDVKVLNVYFLVVQLLNKCSDIVGKV